MNKNIIIGGGIVAVLIAVAPLWYFFSDKAVIDESATDNKNVTLEDPLDVTMSFYKSWLEALQSTSTDPYKSSLTSLPVLSPEMRIQIEQKHNDQKPGDLEPVVCQPSTPKRVGGKEIYKNESKAQVIMFAREGETKSAYQAVVTLDVINGTWQISKIDCTQGEVAPVQEYDLEMSGFLLKQSLQPPLDPQHWHLVYRENEEDGHASPLFFDALSLCTSVEGKETVCDPASFTEGSKAYVKANMSEEGATVKFMTLE